MSDDELNRLDREINNQLAIYNTPISGKRRDDEITPVGTTISGAHSERNPTTVEHKILRSVRKLQNQKQDFRAQYVRFQDAFNQIDNLFQEDIHIELVGLIDDYVNIWVKLKRQQQDLIIAQKGNTA